jgi:excisionase family DNA binding protein
MTRAELAAYWRISLKTLDALVRDDGLPSEMWGRKMRRFSLTEVEAWRRARRAA